MNDGSPPFSATQASGLEWLFLPHTCRSPYPPGSAQLGGFMTLAATRLGRKVAPISAVPGRRGVPRGSTGTGRSPGITSTMSIKARSRSR